MIIPIRCFSCGKVIGNLWESYTEKIKTVTPDEALNQLKLTRACCRRMLLTHVDMMDRMLVCNTLATKQEEKKESSA
jgi:DNA-directed RNA polymerases I, II, and III subunit RPABC5